MTTAYKIYYTHPGSNQLALKTDEYPTYAKAKAMADATVECTKGGVDYRIVREERTLVFESLRLDSTKS